MLHSELHEMSSQLLATLVALPTRRYRLADHCRHRPAYGHQVGNYDRLAARRCVPVLCRLPVLACRDPRRWLGRVSGRPRCALHWRGHLVVRDLNAFWALAAAFGLLLILNGAFDIVYSRDGPADQSHVVARPRHRHSRSHAGFWASQRYIGARAPLCWSFGSLSSPSSAASAIWFLLSRCAPFVEVPHAFQDGPPANPERLSDVSDKIAGP